MHVDKSVSEKF